MVNDQKAQEHFPPPLEWPKIKWQAEVWWTIFPSLLGIILFFFPQLTANSTLAQYRLIIGVPLALAPLIVPFVLWLLMVCKVVIERANYYSSLQLKADQAIDDVEHLRKSYFDLAKQIADERQFEIISVANVDGKMFILIQKRKTPKVHQGDSMIVVHKEDGLLMGIFQVIEVRSKEIYAQGISNLDAVWSGYVRQQGEIRMTPNLAAIYIPQEE